MRSSSFVVASLIASWMSACGKKDTGEHVHEPERVYVSDEDGGTVIVIDASRDDVVGRVPVGKRPRGLRVSPDGKRLYVALSGSPKLPPGTDPDSVPPADRTADGIGIIDLAALKLVTVIPAGQDPELFDITSDGKRLWVSNEETAEASLVDLESGVVVRTVPVGNEPEGVTVHPDGKVVYITNERDNSVSVLNSESGQALTQLATCERPRAAVFTDDGNRAFVSCESSQSLEVVDARAHRVAGRIALGDGVRPMGLAVSPDSRTLYASGGRGKTVHIIDLAGESARVKTVVTDVGERPWGIGLTRRGEKLYTANGPSGDVSVIDTAAGTVVRRIAVGGSPWGVAVR